MVSGIPLILGLETRISDSCVYVVSWSLASNSPQSGIYSKYLSIILRPVKYGLHRRGSVLGLAACQKDSQGF